eukprot:PhM_4_TR5757/c0_g1_i2/m.35044
MLPVDKQILADNPDVSSWGTDVLFRYLKHRGVPGHVRARLKAPAGPISRTEDFLNLALDVNDMTASTDALEKALPPTSASRKEGVEVDAPPGASLTPGDVDLLVREHNRLLSRAGGRGSLAKVESFVSTSQMSSPSSPSGSGVFTVVSSVTSRVPFALHGLVPHDVHRIADITAALSLDVHSAVVAAQPKDAAAVTGIAIVGLDGWALAVREQQHRDDGDNSVESLTAKVSVLPGPSSRSSDVMSAIMGSLAASELPLVRRVLDDPFKAVFTVCRKGKGDCDKDVLLACAVRDVVRHICRTTLPDETTTAPPRRGSLVEQQQGLLADVDLDNCAVHDAANRGGALTVVVAFLAVLQDIRALDRIVLASKSNVTETPNITNALSNTGDGEEPDETQNRCVHTSIMLGPVSSWGLAMCTTDQHQLERVRTLAVNDIMKELTQCEGSGDIIDVVVVPIPDIGVLCVSVVLQGRAEPHLAVERTLARVRPHMTQTDAYLRKLLELTDTLPSRAPTGRPPPLERSWPSPISPTKPRRAAQLPRGPPPPPSSAPRAADVPRTPTQAAPAAQSPRGPPPPPSSAPRAADVPRTPTQAAPAAQSPRGPPPPPSSAPR